MSDRIFFAWADATEQFSAETHARNDEDVFSFVITHEEGQIPTLDVVLKFPEVDGVAIGLLRNDRKQWCFLSWRNDDGEIEPLFFGRMFGFPENISDVLVPIRFLARAKNFVAQKQALADTLRVRPYYDPVFLNDEAIEDPEVILEGLSMAYHVDRLSLEWTVSDILIGDETVNFSAGEIIDGSVEITTNGPPLRAVRVDAVVNWKQSYRGTIIPVTTKYGVKTLAAKSLAESWPVNGASLGGGWVACYPTYARARFVGEHGRHEEQGSWSDNATTHNDGDAISMSWNVSVPIDPGVIINRKDSSTIGSVGGGVDFLNPPKDDNGNISISAGQQQGSNSSSVSSSYQVIHSGKFDGSLWIKPEEGVQNSFVERFTLTLQADLQPLLTDPTAQEETEVITLQGRDVGEGILDYKCVTTLSGQAVQRGQLLYPNLTRGPGGTSFQLALNDGVCGVATTEEDSPLFSDDIGVVTTWGGVDFVCVGPSLPTIMDWQPNVWVRLGTLMCFTAMGGYFYFCDQEGFTGPVPPFYIYKTSITGFVPPALLQGLSGSGLPDPEPVLPLPGYSDVGARINDGGVVWVGLGSGGPSIHVPARGQPGNITSSSFFDTERGAAAVEYGICIGRAKMRTRARTIEITARVPFASAVNMSCRKSASLHVPKIIPGGYAVGKVIHYILSWSGLTGEIYGQVTIGCAIGEGTGDAVSVLGTPTVAELDALEAGAQVMEGRSEIVEPDVSYTPPPPSLTTGGLRFPLTRDQIVLFDGWLGSYETQVELATKAAYESPKNAQMPTGVSGALQTIQHRLTAQEKAQALLNTVFGSVYYELWLRPIVDQHMETPYVVNVSKLTIPKQIDLGA